MLQHRQCKRLISGLKINRPDNEKQGLFGNIYGGTVKNLGVTNIDITGKAYVGGVAAYINNNGNVEYCYTTGDVTATGTYDNNCGGLAGYVNSGTIQYCYSTCDVSTSNNKTGGIVGNIVNGTVKNCYSTGNIKSGGGYLGGVAGNLSGSTVENCYTTGIISSITGAAVGGIAGYVYSSSTIINCVAINSSVSGSFGSGDYVGRIARLANNGCTLSDNYAYSGMTVKGDGKDKAIISDAGGSDGESKDIAGIKAANFFDNLYNNDTGWQYGTGRLPILQGLAGQSDTLPLHIGDSYFTGSGTESDPYLIKNAADLAQLANLVNAGTPPYASSDAYYKLENNIDLSGYQVGEGWKPIGDNIRSFKGHFDGNNKVITGLIINSSNSYQGLFAYIDGGGTVKNLSVINANISCTNWGGAIVGYIENGTIENCYTSGIITCYTACGGIAGKANGNVAIKNCRSSVDVIKKPSFSSSGAFGGVLGSSADTTTGDEILIENCYSTGSISGDFYIGGVVGELKRGKVKNCYSNSTVYADNNSAGGVIGGLSYSVIENCYSTGSVNGYNNVGGVVGEVIQSTIKNCLALNSSITSNIGGTNVGRVAGVIYEEDSLLNNYAFSRIPGTWNNKGLNAIDGADITLQDLYDASFWITSENWYDGEWNDSVWTFSDNKLPKLTGLGGQTDDGGLYLMQRDINNATVTKSSESLTYNGSAQRPSLTVTFDGVTLTEDTDYTVAIISSDGEGTSAGKNVGTVTLKITGIGDFTGTKSITYTIGKRTIAIGGISTPDKTYDGVAYVPVGSVTVSNGYNVNSLEWLYESNDDGGYSSVISPRSLVPMIPLQSWLHLQLPTSRCMLSEFRLSPGSTPSGM